MNKSSKSFMLVSFKLISKNERDVVNRTYLDMG